MTNKTSNETCDRGHWMTDFVNRDLSEEGEDEAFVSSSSFAPLFLSWFMPFFLLLLFLWMIPCFSENLSDIALSSRIQVVITKAWRRQDSHALLPFILYILFFLSLWLTFFIISPKMNVTLQWITKICDEHTTIPLPNGGLFVHELSRICA